MRCRSHAGIAVDRCEADDLDLSAVPIASEEVRAADSAERLREASWWRPITKAVLTAFDGQRSGHDPCGSLDGRPGALLASRAVAVSRSDEWC
jgi:hypothetical protein